MNRLQAPKLTGINNGKRVLAFSLQSLIQPQSGSMQLALAFDGALMPVSTEMHLAHGTSDNTPVSPPNMDTAARLHALGLQLSEARRDLFRSRTVTRLLRDAYRLDDYSSSVDDIASRFLMLVTENMLCDCATLLRADRPGGSIFQVEAIVGATKATVLTSFNLEDIPSSFFAPGIMCPTHVAKVLFELLGASSILGSLDIATGYILVIGGRSNATIDQNFSASDYEVVEGALAVYIDVLDRRRVRRLLEQARQKAEAQDSERESLMAMLAGRMLTVFNELSLRLNILGHNHIVQAADAYSCIRSMAAALAEGRQILESAQEIFEEVPLPTALSLEWVYLPNFLLAVVRNAQPGYLQRGVDLRLKPFIQRLRACIDRIWMEVVLNTLLAEVLSCVEDGAEVVVEAQYREDGSISIIIFGRNRLHTSKANPSRLTDCKVVFSQAAASICRIVEAQGAILTCERLDLTSSRFVLSLSSHDCRRD